MPFKVPVLLSKATADNSALFHVSTHDQAETSLKGMGVKKSAVTH